MKKLLQNIVRTGSLLLFLLAITSQVRATHIYGGDLFYTHISGNTYTITLVIYGDCSGSAFSSLSTVSPEVDVYNGSSFITTLNLAIQNPTAGVEVTPVCPGQINKTRCSIITSSIPGIKRFAYSANYNLGSTSGNWRFQFNSIMNTGFQSGRSNAITNIVINPPPVSASVMLLEATLNNLAAPNSSPTYTTIPTPFFGINAAASYNPGTVDPNGDSLGYALVPGMQLGTTPPIVTYINPYTATAPLAASTGTFNYSNTTGQLNFTPNLLQNSLVVNRVSEYRNGVLVGTSMREMTFVVLNNSNRPPRGSISNISGGVSVNSTTINVCKSSGFLSFNINPSDSDGNNINVVASGLPAGAVFNVANNNTTAPQSSFSWNLSSVTPGTFTFFVTYTDDGCDLSSKQTQAYTINILPDPTLVYTPVSLATCTKKAKFNLTPQGSNSPWTIAIYNGITIIHSFPNITGLQADSLSPGTYTIRNTNAAGCYKDTLITIAPPPAIIPSVAMVQPVCYGDTNGQITLTASGGLAPFKYAIGTGTYSTTNVFPNLYSASYNLHIRDSNECIKDTTVFLSQPVPVSANVSFQQPPCNYFNSGVITLNGINGQAPYQYALNAGAYGSTNTFSGLYSGTYILHIKDAKGCKKDSTFILPDSVKVHANAALTHILCNGNNSGSITLNAHSATAPYKYQLGSGVLSSTNTFPNLTAGNYNFHIEDANRCYLDTNIILNQPTAVLLAPAISHVSCFGQSDGSVIANTSGGVTPYTYALGSGAYTVANTFPSLPIGTYTVHVRDNNNCQKDSTITITQPPKLIFSNIIAVTPDCYGFVNGTFTISGSGGTTPYSYAMNTGTYQGSNFFNVLAAGTYTLHIRDNKNCQADSIVTLGQPTAVVPSAQRKNSTCTPLNNGTVTLAANGGTPNYTYSVGTGAYSPVATFNSLAAGNYIFHIKDSRGCVKDTSITIADSLIITGAPTVTNTTCFKDSNGSISISPSGGVSPYSYAISSGAYQNNSTFNNLKAGNYSLNIKDNLGCIGSISTAVGEPTVISPNAIVKNISCFGAGNGSITFLSSGGTPGYMYAMGSGAFSTNNIITNITPGLYTYYVKDANGCIIDTIIHITQPAEFNFTTTGTNNLCFGDSSGIITVNAFGGTPPYLYKAGNNPLQSSNILAGLKAGPHIVYVEDANQCKQSKFFTLTQPAKLLIDKAVIKHPTCDGYTDGSVIIVSKGGIAPYHYFLDNEPHTNGTEFKDLPEGTYLFSVKDSNNCVYDTSLTLIGLPDIVIDEIVTDDVKCFGSSDGAITILASGGVQPLKYTFGKLAPSDSNVYSPIKAGIYNIMVTDSMNCSIDTVAEVGSPKEIEIRVSAIPNDCEGYDDGGRVSIDVTGGTAPYEYIWSTSPPQYTAAISGLDNGKYYVLVEDANACTDSAMADITYDNCCKISIPDIFTPNGDSKNDKIRILVKGNFQLKIFSIYNRFGQRVFTTNILNGNASEGWDGRWNGEIQDIGTYNYYAVGICGNGSSKQQEFKGTITLIK